MRHLLEEPKKLIMCRYHHGNESRGDLPEAGADPGGVQTTGGQTSLERQAEAHKDGGMDELLAPEHVQN